MSVKFLVGLLGLFSLIFHLLFNPLTALASHIPSSVGYVNDFAGVLVTEQKNALENLLSNYEKQSGNEIAAAFVKNLNGDDIDDFTVRAFEEWKIGKKNKDNGILLLASIDERRMRIEIGYGLEGEITDSQVGTIIRNIISPEFQKGDYYTGVLNGVLAIKNQIAGSGDLVTDGYFPKFRTDKIIDWSSLIIGLAIFSVYIFSYLARSKSIWGGGVVGAVLGVIVGFIVASIVLTIILGVVLAVVGLILDWILSKNYQELKTEGKDTGWWHSGGGFFGHGGGGGFGGFGGGSSGGGGASGSW